MAVTAERAAALREHLRATDIHARYVQNVDLDALTPVELVAEHDDMPAHVETCGGFPSNYR